MKKNILFLFFLSSFLFPSPLWAQEKTVEDQNSKTTEDQNKYGPMNRGMPMASPSQNVPVVPIEKLVESMTATEGLFTLYQKGEKLYAFIKATQIHQLFFLAASISRGIYTGMQWEDMLVYWTVRENMMLLVRPEVRYRSGISTLRESVQRTYPSTILRAVPILSYNGQGYLIDLASIFKTDLAGVSMMARGLMGVVGVLNYSLSRWNKVKVFPHNIELDVELAFTGARMKGSSSWGDSADGSRSHCMGVHYSLSYLPQTTYKPRRADDRVGYFHTAVKDFAQGYDAKTKFQRLIHRWHLEKADPSLEKSPPKQPIIFYLEKTVPYAFRQYVEQGILEWNKAFEKVGFINAIVVRQQTDTEFADLDPEDVRYNFFRWVTNDFGFAAGPSRVNPLTGQILDADIIFDDSMIRYVSGSYKLMGPSSALVDQDEKFQAMIRKMPGFTSKEEVSFEEKKMSSQEKEFQRMVKFMSENGHQVCLFTHGMKHQLQMASMVMRLKGFKKIPMSFLGEYVREIVMHEVGHTLGLYHNFKASSWLPLETINSKEKPKATVGSVMDYNPINFAPRGTPQGHYVTQTIGPYDYWAIEYGYSSSDKIPEENLLAQITSKSTDPSHVYGNDIYASLTDPDPHWIRWDQGSDPVAFAKMRIQLDKELLKDLLERAVGNGENYYNVRRAFGSILGDTSYSLLLAGRNIGGMEIFFHHKGDANARDPIEVVGAQKQRESLAFLTENAFGEKSFEFDPKLLRHLAPGTQWHWESDELSPTPTYPLHEVFLRIQTNVLALLLNPTTLWRIHNSSLQVDKGQEVFALSELFDGITKAIWSELDRKEIEKGKWSASNPFVSSLRRDLQRRYMSIWLAYFVLDRGGMSIPEDAKTLARENLKGLLKKLSGIKMESLDVTSRAHLEETRESIEKALQASFIK